MRVRGGVWAVVFLLGCGRREAAPELADASAPMTTSTASPRARGVVDRLATFASMRDRLGRGGSLVRTTDGFTLAHAPAQLESTLPVTADRPMHLSRNDRPGVTLDVTSPLRPVAGEAIDGAVVYVGADVDTDVTQSVDALRTEELRLLHSARAARRTTWTLTPGPAVTDVRLRDGRVEVLEGGDVRIVTTPMFAVDANGKTVSPTLSLARKGATFELVATLDTEGLAFPVALDPGFTLTFNRMSWNHGDTFGVVLGDGRAVVFPGNGSPGGAQPEVYDPITDKWTVGANVFTVRWGVQPIWLPAQKKVLFAAGAYGPSTTYEVWDPVTGSAGTAAKPLPVGLGTAILLTLPSGKIFAAAGDGSVKGAIYDPAADTWSTIADGPTGNGGAAGVVLASGKVLISGNCCNQVVTRIYDPTTDTWQSGPNMNGARSGHQMHLLPSGKVIALGPDSSGTISAETYDPTANSWTKVTTPVQISGHRSARLPDGKVLIVNVGNKPDTWIYDEAAGFTAGPSMTMRRDLAAVLPFADGRALVAGGNSGTLGLEVSTNTGELYVPAGKTCTTTGDCGGGPCVDGYCCDRGCTETCFACNVPGREGFCSQLTGVAPRTGKSCAPYATCSGGACIAKCTSASDCVSGYGCIYGVCATKLTNGASCFANTDCTSGNCIDGVCCDSTCTDQCKACDVTGSVGTCTSVTGAPHGTRTACTPYACGATTCKTTCSADADCAKGHYCSGTACVAGLTNGKSCTADTQCNSGFCVDGVCCESDCRSACRSCAKAGRLGFCDLVAAGTADPRGICTGECASGCGTSGCTYKVKDTPCGGSCIGNQLTSGGRCTGTSEKCDGSVTAPCAGALKCLDGKSCKGSCAIDGDCVTGACETSTGTCQVPADAGPADTGAPDAAIADTSTPDTATADAIVADATTTPDTATGSDAAEDGPLPPGEGDAATGWPGTGETPKVPTEAIRCTLDAECASGFCVEGVCCDSRCDQPCHSCALFQSAGKCTAEPYGVDLKQDCGKAIECFATCGGKGTCVGAGPGVLCSRNRCTGPSAGVGPAFCKGKGELCSPADAVAFDCGAYACDPAFGACKTTCTMSADCAPGNVCDLGTKSCVAPSAAEDDSGCATSAPGTRNGLFGATLLLAMLGAFRRRGRIAS